MNKKENMFDEFGNYFGNVDDSDDSDKSFEEDDEDSDNPEPILKKQPENPTDSEAPKEEVVLFEDKNYYPTLEEAFPEAEVMIEEEDAMEIEQPILPPPQTQKYHLTKSVEGEFQEQGFLQGILGTQLDNRNLAFVGPYHSGKTMLIDLLIQAQSVYERDSNEEIDSKKGTAFT